MSAPTGTINLDGRDVVLLGSNNYLGLSTHPQVIATLRSMRRKLSAPGASGSRLISGNSELYTTLETNLAKTKNTEAALVFSSGYAANTSVSSPVLAGEGDLILSDALNHASIIDGCRLSRATKKVYRHCDMEHLKALVIGIRYVSAATHRDGQCFQYGWRYRTATRYLRSRYTL